MKLTVIVVSAGQGSGPGAAYPVAGRPMIRFVLDAVRAMEPTALLVVGDGGEQEREAVGAEPVYLARPVRTGDVEALLQAGEAVTGRSDTVLVLPGNAPLLRASTLQQLTDHLWSEGAVAACFAPQPTASGTAGGGLFCFRDDWLWPNLALLLSRGVCPQWGVDLLALAVEQGEKVGIVPTPDPLDVLEVGDCLAWARAGAELRGRINLKWLQSGVILVDPATTYVDAGVEIGPGSVIWPNTFLQGRTSIGRDCIVGPGSVVRDSAIADGCRIELSVVEGAVMEEGSNIGPFGHLRKGAHLGPGVHMGNFGEVKNSYLGPGAKMGHFSYLGDATVGAGANIGAGTITCNFDGQNKHPTIIGADAFVGSGSMLVAPVLIGDGAKTGAGSVVTHDVPPGSVAYGVPARVKSRPGLEEAEVE